MIVKDFVKFLSTIHSTNSYSKSIQTINHIDNVIQLIRVFCNENGKINTHISCLLISHLGFRFLEIAIIIIVCLFRRGLPKVNPDSNLFASCNMVLLLIRLNQTYFLPVNDESKYYFLHPTARVHESLFNCTPSIPNDDDCSV